MFRLLICMMYKVVEIQVLKWYCPLSLLIELFKAKVTVGSGSLVHIITKPCFPTIKYNVLFYTSFTPDFFSLDVKQNIVLDCWKARFRDSEKSRKLVSQYLKKFEHFCKILKTYIHFFLYFRLYPRLLQ